MRTRAPSPSSELILRPALLSEWPAAPARPSLSQRVIAYLRRRRDGVPSAALTQDTRPLVIKALVHELRTGEPGWTYDLVGVGNALRATASLRTAGNCLTIAWKASDEHRIRLSVNPTNVGNVASLAEPAFLADLWGGAHDQLFRYCTWQHLNYVRGWATRAPGLLRKLLPESPKQRAWMKR